MDKSLQILLIFHMVAQSMEENIMLLQPLIAHFSLHWDSYQLCQPSMTIKAKVGILLISRDIFGLTIHGKR